MRIDISKQTNRNTPGSLLSYSPSGELYIVAPGSNGQFLQANSSGVQWASPTAFASSFSITDGTNQQLVNNTETITFNKNNGLRVSVSANRTVTLDLDPAGNLQGLIGGTSGDILYHDGVSFKRLPIGASGRVLTSNGSAFGWITPTTSGGGGSITNTPITVNSSNTISLSATGTDSHTLSANVKVSTQAGNQVQTLPDGLNIANHNYFSLYLSKGTAVTGAVYPDYDDTTLSNSQRYITLYSVKSNILFKSAYLQLRNTASTTTSFILRELASNTILANFTVSANSNAPVVVNINQPITNITTATMPKMQFEVIAGDANIAVEMTLAYLEY